MNENGFIVLHRKLLDWKYFMFSSAVSLWVYIIMKANWKDGYFLGTEIPRGSFATSISKIAADTGLSESTVRRWLKRFEDDGQIERKSSNRCTIIKVSNYATFQDFADEGVNKQMTEQVTCQVTDQMTEQVNKQMTPNRINKQINKVTKKQKDRLGAGSSGKWEKPSLMDVVDVVRNENLEVNPEKFFRYYEARKWRVKDEPVKDWKKLLRSWSDNEIREEEQTVPLPSYSLEDDKEIDYSTMPGGIDEDDEEGDFENL